MKNKVLAMFLILTMLSLGIKTYATTISNYQSQQKQTQDEKDKAKENLQSVTAEKNKEQFEISDAEFESKKEVFQKFENIGRVDYRQEKDMENKYVLLVANGDIVKTENGKDVKKGNALYQNLMDFME